MPVCIIDQQGIYGGMKLVHVLQYNDDMLILTCTSASLSDNVFFVPSNSFLNATFFSLKVTTSYHKYVSMYCIHKVFIVLIIVLYQDNGIGYTILFYSTLYVGVSSIPYTYCVQ